MGGELGIDGLAGDRAAVGELRFSGGVDRPFDWPGGGAGSSGEARPRSGAGMGSWVDDSLPTSGFESSVHVVFTEAESLLLRKHRDYGPKNISQSPGGPMNGLRVRLWDKLARLSNLTDVTAPQFESVEDTFVDLLNYAAIGLLVLRGQWPE